jgi:hypothetical protein
MPWDSIDRAADATVAAHRAARRTFRATALLAVVLMTASGCGGQRHDLTPGLYRAVVRLPGGEVPFGLDVVRENGEIVLYLVNGPERIRLPEARVDRGRLEARLPGDGNRLTARVSGIELTGRVILSAGYAGPAASSARKSRGIKLVFAAERGPAWRFVEKPLTDNADFQGRWSVTFDGDGGRVTRGVAEFTQSFHTVTGSMQTASWKQSPLAGDARDDQLALSLFDGQRAVLYHGRLDERGELVGECWSTATGHARYRASRNPGATL